MTEKYHINPETGRAGKCTAKIKCRFGISDDQHYATKEEARSAYESQNSNFKNPIKKKEKESDKSIDSTNDFDEDSEDFRNVHTFPAYKLSQAIEKINKANRKAERAGIPEKIEYEIKRYDKKFTNNLTGMETYVEYVDFKVINPVVKHDGWSFVGTMDWDPEVGLVTRLVPGQDLLERPKEKLCDICGQQRDRNDTYIVQKDGEQLQVGSSCLKRFTGITPSGLWMLDYDLDEEFDEKDDLDLGRIPRNEQRADIVDTISLGMAVIEKKGWVSRAMSYDYGKTSTADYIFGVTSSYEPRDEDLRREYAEVRAYAEKISGKSEEMLEKIRNLEGSGEYITNLKSIAAGETVSFRNLPILVSGIAAVNRANVEAVEKKARKTSNFIGNPGDKITGTKVKIKTVRAFESNYGYYPQTTYMTIMEDDKGNQIKWTSASGPDMEEGETFMLDRATIKKHDTWNDVKQTVVTRAKLTKLSEDES